MSKEGSVAPKERVNIVYKPAIGNAQEEVELPLKILVMGDLTQRADDRPMEDRKTINVDKDNFNEVLAKQNLEIAITAADKLSETPGGELGLKLKFKSMKDFEPEGVVNQVPELRQLLELRSALNALKSPLGNIPAFRKKIQGLLNDNDGRDKLMKELGLSDDKG